MFYRIKQFIKGIVSYNYDPGDIINYYLNPLEIELFSELPGYEKRHAVDTAKTIEGLNIQKDKDIYIKAALMHDIGKVGSNIGLIKKTILVIMDKLTHSLSKRLSMNKEMFYVYYNHPQIGAELLKNINTDERVVELVRYHHTKDNIEIEGLDILKKADNLN